DPGPDHPADRLPGRGGPRRPAGRAARRPPHRGHAHRRPRRLPLDPLGAARRRTDATADPPARARRRPPRGGHRHRLGDRGRRRGRRLGAAARRRGHRSPAVRRPGRPGERAPLPLRAPDQRRPGHRGADHRRAAGGAALVAAPPRRAAELPTAGARGRRPRPGPGPLRHRRHPRRDRGLRLGQRAFPARLRLRGHRRAAHDGRRAAGLGPGAATSATISRL
ncbi:MAG: GCN5-related N-acetyltransferase, partial [uncultured Blastococcus sp.]